MASKTFLGIVSFATILIVGPFLGFHDFRINHILPCNVNCLATYLGIQYTFSVNECRSIPKVQQTYVKHCS